MCLIRMVNIVVEAFVVQILHCQPYLITAQCCKMYLKERQMRREREADYFLYLVSAYFVVVIVVCGLLLLLCYVCGSQF